MTVSPSRSSKQEHPEGRPESKHLRMAEIRPATLRSVDDIELLSLHRRLHQMWGQWFQGSDRGETPGGIDRGLFLRMARWSWEEMSRRGFAFTRDNNLYRAAVRAGTIPKDFLEKGEEMPEITKQELTALRSAIHLSMEFTHAARRWTKSTLPLVGRSAARDLIRSIPEKAARLSLALQGLEEGTRKSPGSSRGLGLVLSDLSKGLGEMLPTLERTGAPEARTVREGIVWLAGVQDFLADLDEAAAEASSSVAKDIPAGGVHAHTLEGESGTAQDGSHVHVLLLDGATLLTGRDGGHAHSAADLASAEPDGEHEHTFELPEGRKLKVRAGGAHVHELDGDGRTTFGGVHVHEVEVDGQKLQTLLPGTAAVTGTTEASKMKVVEVSPSSLREVPDEEVLSLNRRMHQLYGAFFRGNDRRSADGLSREDVVNAAILVWVEMRRRGMHVSEDTPLFEEAARLQRKGLESLEMVSWEDVAPLAMAECWEDDDVQAP